jgi:hypothetical protein
VQHLTDEQRANYLAQLAFDSAAYQAFLAGIRKGGLEGDALAIAAGMNIAASNPLTPDITAGQLIDDAAWINQVAALADALRRSGISGAFATGQAGATIIAHAMGYNFNPFYTGHQKGIAWAVAARALGDLAALTAGGPGSFEKTAQEAEAGLDLARLLSTGDFATALGNVASVIGDVLGIIQGFEAGGVEGGVEAGFSAEMLAIFLKTSVGTANLIGIVVGVIAFAFGGHHLNPKNSPDISDTARFGQEDADIQGGMGANGQDFKENTSIKALFGGRSGIQMIEEILYQYQTSDKAPEWLRPVFDKLKGMYGMSATGAGVLSLGHAINNQQIVGVDGLDHQVYQYTELGNALYDFATRYAMALASGEAVPMALPAPPPPAGNGESGGTDPGNGSGQRTDLDPLSRYYP